mgnify:FL=1
MRMRYILYLALKDDSSRDVHPMRDLFTRAVKANDGLHYASQQPSPFESSDFRDVTRSSVLYLSAFITAGGLVNIIRRDEPHIAMWLALVVAGLSLLISWRVPASSRHMTAMLHALMSVMVFNICLQVIHGVYYQFMCVLPFYLIWIGMLPTLYVGLGAAAVTSLTVALAGENFLIPENIMLAVASGMVVHFAKLQVQRQLQLASSDDLTGALNRRYLLTQLGTMRAEFIRTNRMSSLVLIDVDGLKAINDSLGHRAGDNVLKSFVKITRERIRGSDLLFRIGGDEFALILADAKSHAALTVSNDIRQLIREQLGTDTPSFAVSFGVCCVDDSASPEDWLERADEALYTAKSDGGDAARLAS